MTSATKPEVQWHIAMLPEEDSHGRIQRGEVRQSSFWDMRADILITNSQWRTPRSKVIMTRPSVPVVSAFIDFSQAKVDFIAFYLQALWHFSLSRPSDIDTCCFYDNRYLGNRKWYTLGTLKRSTHVKQWQCCSTGSSKLMILLGTSVWVPVIITFYNYGHNRTLIGGGPMLKV